MLNIIGGTIFGIFVGALILIPTYGYTANIIKLFQLDFQEPYKAEVIRSAGVVLPFVGCIAGYMELDEEKKNAVSK